MTTPHVPKLPRRTYNIVIAKDGTYAVEVMPSNNAPLTISGFESEEEARRWIEGKAATNSEAAMKDGGGN